MNQFTGRASERSPSEPPEYFLEENDDAESTEARAKKRWLTGIMLACKVILARRKNNNNEN